ncbi:hypothetical protein GALL_84410 [mine drainage metagenome]|uniref:Uncharacterized protein n=1 Tax=mine drainage metagenome TaxID=410659 RepID=A0A1J5T024_9ZZZZ
MPHVGTDDDAKPDAIHLDQTRLVTARKIALLIEYTVVGQGMLVIGCGDLAVAEYRGSVVHIFPDLVRMADDQRDALRLQRQIAQDLLTSLIKPVAQQQIFRRIAAQTEFGSQ